MVPNVHPTAIVEPGVDLGEGCQIGEFVVIRKGSRIGARAILHPHVVVESEVILGEETEVFPGALLGKVPKGAGATAREISCARQVRIGNGCSIGPHAVIFSDVHIGSQCLVGDGASIREQVRVGYGCIIGRYATINYNTTIGNKVKIMDLAHITGNSTVGNGSFISMMVGSANDNRPFLPYDEARIQGPRIGERVLVGLGARVMPGIRIGDDAIVAAGSLVVKDVQANTQVMGSPARVSKILKGGT